MVGLLQKWLFQLGERESERGREREGSREGGRGGEMILKCSACFLAKSIYLKALSV